MADYEWHKTVIKREVGELKTVEDLERAIDYIKNERQSGSTLSLRRQGIKALWWDSHKENEKTWAQLEYRLKDLQAYSNRNPNKDPLNKEQYENLLNACRSEKQKLFIEFLAESGVRISEAVNIKINDCRTVGSFVDIKVISGKTLATTYPKITRKLWNDIRCHFNGHIYLFETTTGHPYTRNYISGQITKIGKLINLNISAHSLRRYNITKRINDGEDLLTISRGVGHMNVGSTIQRYYTGRE